MRDRFPPRLLSQNRPLPLTEPVSSAAPSPARVPAGTRLLRVLAWVLIVAYFAGGLAYLTLRHLVWPNTALWLPYVERILAEAGRAWALAQA